MFVTEYVRDKWGGGKVYGYKVGGKIYPFSKILTTAQRELFCANVYVMNPSITPKSYTYTGYKFKKGN